MKIHLKELWRECIWNENVIVHRIQGNSEKVKEMCEWLKTKGSPHSRIEKAVFSDSTERIYSEFSIRR